MPISICSSTDLRRFYLEPGYNMRSLHEHPDDVIITGPNNAGVTIEWSAGKINRCKCFYCHRLENMLEGTKKNYFSVVSFNVKYLDSSHQQSKAPDNEKYQFLFPR